jgi:hypothetical protein
MAASYPTSIAAYTAAVDYATVVDASIDNAQWAEIVAIETALGLNAGTIGGTGQVAGTVGYNITFLASEITTLQSQITTLTGGTVVSVTATNGSIIISGTSSAPKVATGALSAIASNSPPTANWSNAGFQINHLANGSVSTDAAALGQVLALTGGTMAGAIAMGNNAITGLPNATAAGQPLTYGQLPTFVAPRVGSLTVSSNTYTPSTSYDLCWIVSPTAAFTLANPSGTPVDGQKMMVRVASGSTGYIMSFGTQYSSSGIAILPTTALPASKTCTFGFMWDNSRSLWVLLAFDGAGY